MPTGSAYPGSFADLEAYRDLVDRHPEAEVLGAKNPYTSRNGWMTSILDPEGLICLRLSSEDRTMAISAGSAAVEQYGRNMPDFARVPPSATDAELPAAITVSATIEPPMTHGMIIPWYEPRHDGAAGAGRRRVQHPTGLRLGYASTAPS